MNVMSRRTILTRCVLALGLPIAGCGGEALKTPEGGAAAGPAPASQAEWQKQEDERLKAVKAASKANKPKR
jgi:hypothetical protein